MAVRMGRLPLSGGCDVDAHGSCMGWRLWLRSGPQRRPVSLDRAVHSPGQARRATPDHRYAAHAGRSVLRRAHGVPVAPPAAAPGIPAVADDLRLLPPVPDHRGLGNHPSFSGHDAARERRPGGQSERRDHRHPERQDHGKGGPRGYDAAKKVKGRKRHVAVDTLGLLLGVIVHAADIQDADSAWDLLKQVKHLYCWLKVVFADSIYDRIAVLIACFLLGLTLIIVRRIAGTTGFVVLPKRWIVERTLGWLGRCRRLSKDYEELPEVSEAMVTLAMIRLMLHRLVHPNRKRLPAP